MRRQSRRNFLRASLALAGLGLLAGCGVLPVPGQATAKVPRIGYLAFDPAGAEHQAFRDGLRELGYVEGRTIVTEERWAESIDQFPALAVELVGLPVDLIVAAGGTQSAVAAKQATDSTPIVFASASDPVQSGLVASLARPGATSPA